MNREIGYGADGRPLYRIEYVGSGDDGTQIVDQGWRVYAMTWHKHRFGRPVVNKYAREKLIGVCESREEARNFARGYFEGTTL